LSISIEGFHWDARQRHAIPSAQGLAELESVSSAYRPMFYHINYQTRCLSSTYLF
jgi:hypothetical protein